MKYVLFWIEMLKLSSELVGNWHLRNRKENIALQSYCSYRLKNAIRALNDDMFELGQGGIRIRPYIDDASEADQFR